MVTKTVSQAVTETLAALTHRAEDAGARALASRLATAIDETNDPQQVERLSARLLAVLVELGATPKSRSTLPPTPVAPNRSALAQMRDQRPTSVVTHFGVFDADGRSVPMSQAGPVTAP